ncbi:pentapeptide repeat-containing protein [Nitrosomonas sp.]|uniref:pentapeptide repeat-containing protein n=1 Tax=Nitrosomonas sp. TaxID=42353 RepID=UPI00344DEBF6
MPPKQDCSRSGANFRAANFNDTWILNINMSHCNLTRARCNGISATLIDFSASNFYDAQIYLIFHLASEISHESGPFYQFLNL